MAFFQSRLFPVGQGHEFVHDLLQSLQSPFLIGGSDHFFTTLQVLTVCFTDFCDFFSQLSNALFDGLRHRDRLAEHFGPGQRTSWLRCISSLSLFTTGGTGGHRRNPTVCSLPSRAIYYLVRVFKLLMFTDFTVTDRWTKKQVHCLYQALIVAIATRHADAVDIKFLVDGRPVWVALPHPAWVEYQKRTGKVITDPLAVEIAGHYLKTALESGEGMAREMYSLTVAETLHHIEGVVSKVEPAVATTR